MTRPAWNPILDAVSYPAERFAPLADRLAALLRTASDVLLIQGEAIIALEAVATSLGRPGATALNVVTSPYGTYFGHWLRRGGATVHDVIAESGQPIALEAVTAALDALPAFDIVAMVHGEAANGAINPIEAIVALAKVRGALSIVDAVASVGAHTLDVDAIGIDVCVIGPQKALGGPAGLSAIAVNQRAWSAVNGSAISTLSLLDQKTNWLDRGRGALPGTPSAIEFWALEAALDRVEAEGIDALVARHQLAKTASRAGLRALGVAPWIAADDSASALVTAVPVPAGIDAEALIASAARFGVALGRGFGDIEGRIVRLIHTGSDAGFRPVLANVVGLGVAFGQLGCPVSIGAAAEAVASVYGERG